MFLLQSKLNRDFNLFVVVGQLCIIVPEPESVYHLKTRFMSKICNFKTFC